LPSTVRCIHFGGLHSERLAGFAVAVAHFRRVDVGQAHALRGAAQDHRVAIEDLLDAENLTAGVMQGAVHRKRAGLDRHVEVPRWAFAEQHRQRAGDAAQDQLTNSQID
jgi:hypothetical protein